MHHHWLAENAFRPQEDMKDLPSVQWLVNQGSNFGFPVVLCDLGGDMSWIQE